MLGSGISPMMRKVLFVAIWVCIAIAFFAFRGGPLTVSPATKIKQWKNTVKGEEKTLEVEAPPSAARIRLDALYGTRLAHDYPPEATEAFHSFPYKLWQTAPENLPADRKEQMKRYGQSWHTLNPGLRHEILNDEAANTFVAEKFAHRPDIVDLYVNLNPALFICKADMLRYLMLIADGGLYADADVSCDVPIEQWVPEQYKDKATLVIGQEFDYKWRGEGRELASQFSNWLLMAKPNNTHLISFVDEIVRKFQGFSSRANVPYRNLTLDMLGPRGDTNIIMTTGPKIMSMEILKSLSVMLDDIVDDRNISDVVEPRLLGDVLIMPNVAFAAAQADYRKDRGPILVTHHYFGSWKHDEEQRRRRDVRARRGLA